MTTTTDELKTLAELLPCPKCRAPCTVQDFSGGSIEGNITLWMCSNVQVFGGSCDRDAYFTAEGWNTRDNLPAIIEQAAAIRAQECKP